jgi:hypothetical protein
MKKLKGVKSSIKDKYSVFWLKDLSDDLKNYIKEQFAEICHGENYVHTGRITYSYKNTVKEFLKRYEEKPDNIKIGMIGELLVHLIFRYYFDKFKAVTPFFNMEERSIKKGYDVILTEVNSRDLWITEVKSGILHKEKNSDQTMSYLINAAKRDLNERLNNENTSLWLEAINCANILFENNNTLKEAVINVLRDYSDEATNGIYSSYDKNVILTGVLFSSMRDIVTENNIHSKQTIIENGQTFKKVYVLAVQKETYSKVYEFLKK